MPRSCWRKPANDILSWPLGVATVALAMPVYRNRERLRGAALPIAIGAMLGPLVLNVSGVTDPIPRGIALGSIAHGQGDLGGPDRKRAERRHGKPIHRRGAVLTSLLAVTYIPLLLQLLAH